MLGSSLFVVLLNMETVKMIKQDAPLTQKIDFAKLKPLAKMKDLGTNQEIYTTKERAIERWETDGGLSKARPAGKNNSKNKI